MSPAAIHQFVPSLARRDAIGGHTLQIQRVVRGMGLRSELYVHEATPDLRSATTHYRDYRSEPDAWLLYQCSTGSPMAGWLAGRPEVVLSDYHNITPAEHFAPWEPHVAAELTVARHQLADLAAVTAFAWADSAYNEVELVELDYPRTAVLPILVDPSSFDGPCDPAVRNRLEAVRAAGGAVWLFVGRISPNKCQHDLIKAFAAYRRLWDPNARLYLVGGSSSNLYETVLRRYVDDLGLTGAVELCGSVSAEALAAHYATADVYVCLSEHEGFCVPLLEAMHHRVPIVAFGAAAVPETLGAAGLVLDEKSPLTVAAAVDRVVHDVELRRALVDAGSRRVADFSLAAGEATLVAAVEALSAELG